MAKAKGGEGQNAPLKHGKFSVSLYNAKCHASQIYTMPNIYDAMEPMVWTDLCREEGHRSSGQKEEGKTFICIKVYTNKPSTASKIKTIVMALSEMCLSCSLTL